MVSTGNFVSRNGSGFAVSVIFHGQPVPFQGQHKLRQQYNILTTRMYKAFFDYCKTWEMTLDSNVAANSSHCRVNWYTCRWDYPLIRVWHTVTCSFMYILLYAYLTRVLRHLRLFRCCISLLLNGGLGTWTSCTSLPFMPAQYGRFAATASVPDNLSSSEDVPSTYMTATNAAFRQTGLYSLTRQLCSAYWRPETGHHVCSTWLQKLTIGP